MDYKDTDTQTDTAWTELPATHTHQTQSHTRTRTHTHKHRQSTGLCSTILARVYLLFSDCSQDGSKPNLFLMFYILTAAAQVQMFYLCV